ncbi:MAG TPA: GNAT family N-acetyltransferase [Gammaproteobacteria bacterium]|nr:GNAT family N-acetyltransferase [Gammaproteobacteria bacterium]
MRVYVVLTFKIASEPSEFEQIHRLNYETFVGEIPQHAENDEGLLIDRFDAENTYIICLDDGRIVGMLAARGKRPFSLDAKLDNLDDYFPGEHNICEIRLLAVEKGRRYSRVFAGLAREMTEYWLRHNFDMAVISGTPKQIKLYERLGFMPFGPMVGSEQAPYQPMYLTRESFQQRQALYQRLQALPTESANVPLSFLPGPVRISADVRKTFSDEPASHRSKQFVGDFQQLKRQLCKLANANQVEVMLGSGTLANDVVGAQLSLLDAPGLIVTNGEFGERLLDQAARFQLPFDVVQHEWGESFDYARIREALEATPGLKWLWAVHCETSTSMLNDMARLKAVCAEFDLRLALDCCSSLGVVPVDLDGVWLAASGSGKGLSSYAGLALVYHQGARPNLRLPRYLDLGLYAEKSGIPFTHSSNLVYAMRTAMRRFDDPAIFDRQADLAAWLRGELHQRGFDLLVDDAEAAPGIVTVVLPDPARAEQVGDALEADGFLLSCRSEYLLRRGWLQISLMGDHSTAELRVLLGALERHVNAAFDERKTG